MRRITIDEAAEQLRVDPVTIRRLIARGELPACRIGRTALIRIDQADLDKLLKPVPAAGEL